MSDYPVIPKGILAKTPKAKRKDELASLDVEKLREMDAKTLAAWQSEHDKDEPQWRLAEYEWQRRAGVPARRIAIIALVISFISLLWTAWVYWHPRH
jgi:hypothetical protein